jgi:hypothetical protein
MIEIEIVVHHDWEDKVSEHMVRKGVSTELLLEVLNFVKGSLSNLEREQMSELAAKAPEEIRTILEKPDAFNPAYRIVFDEVERGSVKAKGLVAGAIMSLTTATGGHLAADTIKGTGAYQNWKEQAAETLDKSAEKFGFILRKNTKQFNDNKENRCSVNVAEKARTLLYMQLQSKRPLTSHQSNSLLCRHACDLTRLVSARGDAPIHAPTRDARGLAC